MNIKWAYHLKKMWILTRGLRTYHNLLFQLSVLPYDMATESHKKTSTTYILRKITQQLRFWKFIVVASPVWHKLLFQNLRLTQWKNYLCYHLYHAEWCGVKDAAKSKYNYQDSKLLAPVVYFAEPVKTSLWTVRDEHMHSTLDFCPKPTRKKTNIPQLKSSKELIVLINKLCCDVKV